MLEQDSGLPRALLVYPEWNRRDTQLHDMVAARAYALVANADLNLMLFQSNLYGDAFEDKTRLGFSFSRYFFDDYELHLEALLQRGSARNYPTPGCLDDVDAAVGCVLAIEPLLSQRRLDEKRLRPQVLVGSRYQFSDESLLSVEYLYQADGLKRSEFQDVVNGLSLLSVANDFGLDTSRVLGQLLGATDGGLPQRFRFVPISRHYAFLTFQKPKIRGCLDRATRGSYKLDGEEVGDRDFDELAEVRNRKIGFIFQSFNLIPVLDVAENIEFPCLVRKDGESRAALRKRVEGLADAVGLLPYIRHRPDELSGGQRQRVAIARALITQPRLVLADEPTANLDSATSEQIIDLMLALNREKGVTFLFSTHDPRVVSHARRALHIHDGRMLSAEPGSAAPHTPAPVP